MAILSLVLPFLRLLTSCIGCGTPGGLSVSSLRGYRSVLSAVFRFHLPSLSSDPVIRDLFCSFQLSSAERVLRPPDWDLSTVLTYLVSPAFVSGFFPRSPAEDLVFIGSCHCQVSWWAAGSIFHCHLCGWGCLPFLPPAVCRQVGVAPAFHPTLLLGVVLSSLCGWSWYRPPFVPREGPPLVSASGQVSVSRSPSPFRVTSAPFSRYV